MGARDAVRTLQSLWGLGGCQHQVTRPILREATGNWAAVAAVGEGVSHGEGPFPLTHTPTFQVLRSRLSGT